MKDQLTRVASASCQVSIRGTSELSAEYQRNIRVVSSVSEEHRLIRLRAGKHQLCISQVSLAQSAANRQPRLSIHKGGVDSPSRTPHPSGERSPICQRASRRTRPNLASRWFDRCAYCVRSPSGRPVRRASGFPGVMSSGGLCGAIAMRRRGATGT